MCGADGGGAVAAVCVVRCGAVYFVEKFVRHLAKGAAVAKCNQVKVQRFHLYTCMHACMCV